MVRRAVLAFAHLLFALAFPFARLVTLLLLQRKFVLGRLSILLVEEPGGHPLPQLPTFLGELLLEGTHDFGDDL